MLRDCLFLILGYLKTIVLGIGTIINGQRTSASCASSTTAKSG